MRILDPYFTFGNFTEWDYKVLCGTIEGITMRRSTNILKDGYGVERKGAISLLDKLREEPIRMWIHRRMEGCNTVPSRSAFNPEKKARPVPKELKGRRRAGLVCRLLRWHGLHERRQTHALLEGSSPQLAEGYPGQV